MCSISLILSTLKYSIYSIEKEKNKKLGFYYTNHITKYFKYRETFTSYPFVDHNFAQLLLNIIIRPFTAIEQQTGRLKHPLL